MSSAGRSTVDPATARLREARATLERAVRAGEAVRTEDVLADYPDLGDSSDAFLELAYSEFVLREQLGQEPKPADWLARFPKWETDLRQLFDVHFEYREKGDDLEPVFHPDFEILEEVGRGGMGVVYRARQKSLNRVVALKVVISGEHAGAKELARFKREGEAAASLQHPNIVQVFEVGEADGRPFCAMEFVGGGTLSKKLDGVPWAARPAAEFLATVARAVHHAHERGIVHRDLKPANVLLAVGSEQWVVDSMTRTTAPSELHTPHSPLPTPSPKVTDFGLAKCLTDSDPGPTRTGDLLGTPAYMAPEQAEGRSKLVGPATDVWALGVIFYEMLTGRPPFQGESAVETIRQVQHAEPVSPRRLQPRLSRDLETVCLKCLRKSPVQRYAGAAALADDLERWLRSEPILARPVGAVGRLRRWCARNPRVAALSGAVLALLVAAAWLGTLAVVNLAAANTHAGKVADQERVAREKEEEARKKEEVARKKEGVERLNERRRVVRLLVADGVRRLDEGDSAGAALWFAAALENEPDDERVEAHRVRLGTALRDGPELVRAFRLSPVNLDRPAPCADGSLVFNCAFGGTTAYDVRTGLVRSAIPVPATPRDRGFPTDTPTSNGKAVAAVRGGKVLAWDTFTGAELPIPLPPEYGTLGGSFTPDGSRYVGHNPNKLSRHVFTAVGEQLSGPLGESGLGLSIHVLSPNGKYVAVGGKGGVVRVWETATGKELPFPFPHGAQTGALAFSRDGARLVTTGTDMTAQVWDTKTGKEIKHRLQHGGRILWVGFGPDGRRVVTAGTGRAARVWDADAGVMVAALPHPNAISGAAFSPDGKSVATHSLDTTARVWEVETGRPLSPLLHHTGPVRAAEFTADGSEVVVACLDGGVRVWGTSSRLLRATYAHPNPPTVGGWAPGGDAVVTVGLAPALVQLTDLQRPKEREGVITGAVVWDPANGTLKHTLPSPGRITSAAFSPDGARVATISAALVVKLWDAGTGLQLGPDLKFKSLSCMAFVSADVLATGGANGQIQFWDARTGLPLGKVFQARGGVVSMVAAPHGQRLLTLGAETRLWDVETGATLLTDADPERLTAAMSPDGNVVATVSRGGKVRYYGGGDGRPTGREFDVGKWTQALVLGPEGVRAATTAANERAVQVWDAVAGVALGPPLRHRDFARPAEFSPDGRFLATTGDDGAARAWEVETGAGATPNLEHGPAVRFARFSPDGRRLLTGSVDKNARVWDLTRDARPVAELLTHARLLAARRLDDRTVPVQLTAAEETDLFGAWRANKP